MNEVTRGHVERLGSLGYSVVAPDLFDRDRGRVACVVKTMGEFRYSPMRAEHDPAAAEDSWRRLESFFAARL